MKKVEDIEIIREILKTPAGDTIIGYFQEEIATLEKAKAVSIEKILLSANPPMDELVALKVVAGSHNKVVKILEQLIEFRNYERPKKKIKDETFGL